MENYPSFISQITIDICTQMAKQQEDLIIEAFKRKGFEFNNRAEMENFIRLNCRCEDNTDRKQKTYFINDEPFMLWEYNNVNEFSFENGNDDAIVFKGNFGNYLFL
jgi:hypothetical protein